MQKLWKNKFMCWSKLAALTLALMLSLALLPIKSEVYALNGNVRKREAVFASLKGDGSVSKVYVVNHFTADTNFNFTDYGNYEDLRELTEKNSIKTENGEQRITSGNSEFSYQGTLKDLELPWQVSLTYTLNGKKVSAAETAGQNGKLRIDIKVRKNRGKNYFFAEHYSLQIALNLTEGKARILKTDTEAMLQDAGKGRMINWIVLPDTDKDMFVELAINNFALQQIQFSGINMAMDFGLQDIDKEFSSFTDLIKSIETLNDGTTALSEGLTAAVAEYDKLGKGALALSEKQTELTQGVEQYFAGSDTYIEGSRKFVGGAGALTSGFAEITQGVENLSSGVSELYNNGQKLIASSGEISKGLKNMSAAISGIDLRGVDLSMFDAEEMAKLTALADGMQSVNDGLTLINTNLKGLVTVRDALTTLKKALEAKKALFASLPVPEPLQLRDVAGWEQYFADKGVTLTNAQKQDILPELARLSGEQHAYQKTYYALQELTKSLLDEKQGLPALIKAMDGFVTLQQNLEGIVTKFAALNAGVKSLVAKLKDFGKEVESLTPLLQNFSTMQLQVQKLAAGYSDFHAGLGKYVEGVGSLKTGIAGDEETQGLQDGVKAFAKGLEAYAQNGEELIKGGDALFASGTLLSKGLTSYISGAAKLADGVSIFGTKALNPVLKSVLALAAGTKEMRQGTAGMDKKIKQKIDEKLAPYRQDFAMRSFVDARNNAAVENVQFVFLTEAIAKDKESNTAPRGEKKTFWQRFCDLWS